MRLAKRFRDDRINSTQRANDKKDAKRIAANLDLVKALAPKAKK
ncbi:MAG: hypothetical protein PUF61_00255 [Spirochaetales bacterium]|nr:hypothetical protein [Spirochaetales bacterium]